jgi:Zn-dependent M28 family amino/carboxypeptidase
LKYIEIYGQILQYNKGYAKLTGTGGIFKEKKISNREKKKKIEFIKIELKEKGVKLILEVF